MWRSGLIEEGLIWLKGRHSLQGHKAETSQQGSPSSSWGSIPCPCRADHSNKHANWRCNLGWSKGLSKALYTYPTLLCLSPSPWCSVAWTSRPKTPLAIDIASPKWTSLKRSLNIQPQLAVEFWDGCIAWTNVTKLLNEIWLRTPSFLNKDHNQIKPNHYQTKSSQNRQHQICNVSYLASVVDMKTTPFVLLTRKGSKSAAEGNIDKTNLKVHTYSLYPFTMDRKLHSGLHKLVVEIFCTQRLDHAS